MDWDAFHEAMHRAAVNELAPGEIAPSIIVPGMRIIDMAGPGDSTGVVIAIARNGVVYRVDGGDGVSEQQFGEIWTADWDCVAISPKRPHKSSAANKPLSPSAPGIDPSDEQPTDREISFAEIGNSTSGAITDYTAMLIQCIRMIDRIKDAVSHGAETSGPLVGIAIDRILDPLKTSRDELKKELVESISENAMRGAGDGGVA